MDRVSDATLTGLIIGFDMKMQEGMGEGGVRNILSALTELRDRRQADEAPDYSTKSQPSPMGLYRCNKRSYRRQAEKKIDKAGA